MKTAHRIGTALLAAFALAWFAGKTIDAIDRELDAAERAAAVPTHPNFGRAK
jgi:hypothetical protein